MSIVKSTSPEGGDLATAFAKLQRCFMSLQLLDLENMTSLSVALERSRLATEWLKLLEEHQLSMAYKVNQVSLELIASVEKLKQSKSGVARTHKADQSAPEPLVVQQLLTVLRSAAVSRKRTQSLLAELADLTNRIETHSVVVARANEDLERSAHQYVA